MAQSAEDSTKDSREEDHRRNQSFEHPWIDSKTQTRLLNVKCALPEKFECTFEIVSISALANKHFHALSYTWGEARSARDVRPIIVHKQQFYVRTNLWGFLARCQNLTIDAPIFIDAICLDQLNNEERSNQVAFMSEIYQNASITHLWLGEPYEEHQRKLECFQFNINQGTPTSQWEDDSIIGLTYICSREYWQRLWIVQELLLSKKILIYCGSIIFDWESLERLARLPLADACLNHSAPLSFWSAWAIEQPRHFSQQQALENGLFQGWRYASSLIHHRFTWRKSRRLVGAEEQWVGEAQGLPLHLAADYFRSQQCRDAHDKIFALLGILDRDGRQMVECNYNIDQEDMFIQVAAAGFVSRWKSESQTRTVSKPTFEDSMFCVTICEILGFSTHLMRTHMSRALEIAESHIAGLDNKDVESSSTSKSVGGNGERRQSFGGIAEPASVMHLTANPQTKASPFQETFREFCHKFDAHVDEFAITDITQLKLTIAVIQARQRKERRIKNFPRIEPLFKVLETYSVDLDDTLGEQRIISFIWVRIS
jgi:hypothetical protein